MIYLSDDQKIVLKQIYNWYATKASPYITLGGYAGTGKTTIVSIFSKILRDKNPDMKIAFCSFTGKAVRVLKNTLVKQKSVSKKDNISTIHSLIYEPIENQNAQIVGWKKKEKIDFDLIITDEASMIDSTIWYDLMSYKIPILAVGDHGQLPPINPGFNLMLSPEIKLETIHRQSKDNPIVTLAKWAREGTKIESKEYSKKVKKYSYEDPETKYIMEDILSSFDDSVLILCGINSTRVKINNMIRLSLGFDSEEPTSSDKIICLRNNHEKKILNGMLGEIKHIKNFDEKWFELDIKFEDENDYYSGLGLKEQFNATQPINFTKERKKTLMGDLFDFGYCLTVHKAQGSESQKVILFEERNKHMTDEDWNKWLYTGISRAKEELIIFGY